MRTKVCKHCGKTFITPTGHSERYLCEDCYKQAKLASVYRERICRICGQAFMGYPRSMYCPACSELRKREQAKKRGKKAARPLGSIDHCENCGKEYVVKSARQRYCPTCAETVVYENVKRQKRAYFEQNKERLSQHKEEMRKDGYVCVICGKIFDKSSTTVTCSPECEAELLRRRRNQLDYKRGKRKLPPEERYKSGRPQSGIVGVTWYNGKWQATYKRKYLGIFSSVADAAAAIEEEKGKDNR